jgi:Domain of unknown function (DUF4279)
MIYASASLRIMGLFKPASITAVLGLTPSHVHRKGDLNILKKPYPHDMWSLGSGLDKISPLNDHLVRISMQLHGKHDALRSLKDNATIDLFCGLTCMEQAGFGLTSEALKLITDLEINIEFSLVLFEGEPND